MRRRSALLVLSAVLTPLVVALPTVSTGAAAAPVAPAVRELPVPGVVTAAAARGGRARAHLPARATDAFTTVGVTWAADAAVGEPAVEVRTRTRGRWSAWTALDTHDEHGPDASSPDTRGAAAAGLRGGSAPFYAGRSDGVEVRVVQDDAGTAPRDVRVALVDAGTGPGDAVRAPAGTAHAATAVPQVVARAQWGADERLNTCTTAYSPSARAGFVHHTAGRNDYTAEESAAVVRGIYAFHTQSRGWCDVGYNFLVDRWGRIFEGRAGGIDKVVVGAHTGGFNAHTFSGSLMGTFDTAVPPAAMLDALERLFAWKLGRSHRDPHGTVQLTSSGGGTSRYPAGQVVTFDVISGHRDAGRTGCPGAQVYARLGEVRDATARHLGPGFADPSATAVPATPSTGGSVVVASRVLAPTRWRAEVRSASGLLVHTATGDATSALRVVWDQRDALGVRVPDGDYRVRLTGDRGELPWEGVVTLGQAPVGVLDEATVTRGAVTSSLRLRGWALDRDTPAPVTVRAYLDGVRVASFAADDDRPDIAAAFPGYGSAHGFDETVIAPNGQYALVVRAVDTGTGREAQVDSRTVVLGDPPRPAVGAFDALTVVPDGVRVTGWADDPQATASTSVDVTVDGRLAATLPADRSRPDVARLVSADAEASGFDGTVPVPDGGHTVCVVARLVNRTDTGTSLGCRPVRMLPGAAPTGVLDAAQNARDVAGVRLAGWTIDPDTSDPTRVHVHVDGRPVLDAAADRSRPDVGRVFPGYGDAHGFDLTVPAAPGPRTVCAYAINAGPGSTHTGLGCRTVQVAVDPFGALDGIARTADGRVRVRGWAADPNAGASPVDVHVYVGPSGHARTADLSRPDVARAFPGYGDRHGYDLLLPVPTGPVTVCAYAISTGPGQHRRLGCRAV